MIVPLENQVASLEPSKRLVELGLKVKSYFVRAKSEGVVVIVPRWYLNHEIESCHYTMLAPALTVAELLARMPDEVEDDYGHYYVSVMKIQGIYHVTLCNRDGDMTMPFSNEIQGSKLADCLVAMLIWLIDHKHVTVEELIK